MTSHLTLDDLLPSRKAFASQCRAALHDSPCIAITGPPGVGKSAILLALSGDITGLYLDLRPVQGEAAMLNAIASLLSLHHEPKPSAPALKMRRDQIIDALERQPDLTLCLDHAAHLHAHIQTLLSALKAPHARVIIASRRDIAPCTHLALGALPQDEAITLLTALAPTSRRASLEAARDDVAELAHMLEYNPLAITICAARLGLFQPKDVLTRLHTSRSSVTIQEAFAWSWQLLSQDGQRDLAACAVLSGWFDMELAQEVLQVESTEDALKRLEHLHAHSLVELEERHTRWHARLARPLILFLRAEPSVTDLIAEREHLHAKHMSYLGEALYIKAKGNRWRIQPEMLSDIVSTHLSHAQLWWRRMWEASPSPDTLKDLLRAHLGAGLALWLEQDFASLIQLHTLIGEELLEHPNFVELDDALKVYVLCLHADHYALHYDAPKALSYLDRAALIATTHDLELLVLARMAEVEPQYRRNQALPHIERALTLAKEDDYVTTELLLARAVVSLEQRDLTAALAHFEVAKAFGEETEQARPLARTLIFLGFALHEAGQQALGNQIIEQSKAAFMAQHDIIGAAHALRVRAWQSVDDQDIARSELLLTEMLYMADTHGLGWMSAYGYFLRGQHELDQQRYAQALIAYERARYHLEHEQMFAMLAASQLYRSICYKLIGDLERAREIYEDGLTHLPHLRAPTGQVHYACERAEWLAHDGKRKQATDTIKEARGILKDANAQDFLSLVTEIYQCKIDLFHYFNLKEQNKPTERLYGSILTRLSHIHRPFPNSHVNPLGSCIEVRLGWALLKRALPEEFLRRFLVEVNDPDTNALIIDADERAYRAPQSLEWVSLGKRENPYKLLMLLVERHLKSPGDAISSERIVTMLWPNEQITAEAAKNRLYVTLSSLRRSGKLKPHILSHEGGYMLARDLEVMEV